MPASLLSLLGWPFRAIARRLPSGIPTVAWVVEGGVSVAVWTAPEDHDGTVSRVHLEIRPGETPRRPFVLAVSPDGYMTESFVVGDLETARELALRQLAIARKLPAAPQAEAEIAADSGAFRPVAEAVHAAAARDKAA